MESFQYFISCDWGTSNFRLRLVETESLRVLKEHRTEQGVRAVHNSFLDQDSSSQEHVFATYLKQQIKMFPSKHQQHLVVLSGMASSNIGLKELEYANLPFGQSGEGLQWARWTLENKLEILLISGVKSKTGVMRGEEIQAIGLGEVLEPYNNAVLVLPGTHSKHIVYEQRRFIDFKTYMTGELFEIISSKSILATSVFRGDWDNVVKDAFIEGVEIGISGKFTERLFEIRARGLFKLTTKEANFYFLSGMLIGDELSYLATYENYVFLAADQHLSILYQEALNLIIDKAKLIIVSSKDLEKALLAGQQKILKLNGR